LFLERRAFRKGFGEPEHGPFTNVVFKYSHDQHRPIMALPGRPRARGKRAAFSRSRTKAGGSETTSSKPGGPRKKRKRPTSPFQAVQNGSRPAQTPTKPDIRFKSFSVFSRLTANCGNPLSTRVDNGTPPRHLKAVPAGSRGRFTLRGHQRWETFHRPTPRTRDS